MKAFLMPVGGTAYDAQVRQTLTLFIDELVRNLAPIIESGRNDSNGAAPTTGTHGVGEFVWNAAPSELGSPGSRYVVLGWSCVATGAPGTWVQARALTGN